MPYDRNEMNWISQFFNEKPFADNGLCKLHVDLEDKGDHFELTADLPGFSKDDIKIDIEDKIMTITAKKEESKETKEKNYICRERRYGSYTRSFDISGAKADEISGSFKNGVLSIIIPKKEAPVKTNRRLELSDGEPARQEVKPELQETDEQ